MEKRLSTGLSTERLTLGVGFDPVVEREHLERYAYAGQFVRNKTVLDVACGSGFGLGVLAEFNPKKLVGVDRSLQGLIAAQSLDYKGHPALVAQDAHGLGAFPDAVFDFALSFETIEHLERPELLLSGVARVLRKGGRFLLSTPERRLASVLFPFRGHPENPFHRTEFTLAELEQLVAPWFEIEEVLGQAFVPRALSFWPVQFAAKALGHVLRRVAGSEVLLRPYREADGLHVHSRVQGLARFWVLSCVKKS